MIQVNVYDGKYTVCIPERTGETLHALRYGEPWQRDLCGDNLVFQLAYELHEARQELEKLKAVSS